MYVHIYMYIPKIVAIFLYMVYTYTSCQQLLCKAIYTVKHGECST